MANVVTHAADPEDLEVDLVLETLWRRWGYDFRRYARAPLKRRLARAVVKTGGRHLSDLIPVLIHDEGALRSVVMELFVSVTEMFRDPGFFRAFLDRVVPVLATYPRPKIWHAGCATGEEVYSVAILLQEAGLLSRTTVYATDSNTAALDVARKGVYVSSQVVGREAAYRGAGGKGSLSDYYVTPSHGCASHDQDRCVMRGDLRKQIVWSSHRLGVDSMFTEVHLILCRNTLIYFDRELKRQALGLFRESLVPGGILALGRRETLTHSGHAEAFESLVESERIYQKCRGAARAESGRVRRGPDAATDLKVGWVR